MISGINCDEDLLRRLPLPLAQLYRRAHNAKSALESHLTAFYLWEAALKLLAAVAFVEHAAVGSREPPLTDDQRSDLQNLARPSLGHWWRFVKVLVPRLADGGDERFRAARDLLLGRARDDMPRAAGLDAALRETLAGKTGARATVKLAELFDHLVQLRNEDLGHGAAGQRPREFYARISPALLAGVAEVLSRLDVRAGRRLVYVADIHRQPTGGWLVERYELAGESPRRLETLEIPESATAQLPRPSRVYLESVRDAGGDPQQPAFLALHPLLAYDADSNEVRFFNEFDRRGPRLNYLCYTTSASTKEADPENDLRRLLARILGQEIEPQHVEQWAEQAAAEDPAAAVADSTLRQIGEFELLSKLGWGGMGVVYRARQPTLGREVALKVMRQTGNPKAESRFSREIRALGHVEHTNLVKVFTSGADGDRWFYTMELVEGSTLEAVQTMLTSAGSRAGELDLCVWKETLGVACAETRKSEEPVSVNSNKSDSKSGSHPSKPIETPSAPPIESPPAAATNLAPTDRSYLRQMAEFIRQVSDAAHALHEAGVIHRDIKPGNIMVTDDGNRAVLMDLGLAQLTDEVEGRLTRTREFLGTPRYASPEQVMAAGRVDRRSDVYSLGATLCELLTLRPVYGITDETPFAEVARRIQVREPERVRKYNPRVPRDLDAIVLKCLEKDPECRYPTAHELAEDLGRFLANQPVRARPVGELERTWRWCRRNPLVSGLLATVVLVVAVGLIGVTLKWRDAEANLVRALEAERIAHEGRYAADMRLASQAADDGNLGRALDLLQHYRVRPGETDLRGFEWRYMKQLFKGDSQATFHGDPGPVTSVAFAPDGVTLATGDKKGRINLIDSKAQKVLATTQTDGLGVSTLEFSPDGTSLAAATGDWDKIAQHGKVLLYDAVTLALRDTLESSSKAVNAATFSPDGRLLAAASEDGAALVWRLPYQNRQEALVLPGHKNGLNRVRFSPDGSSLAAGSGDGHLQIWSVPTFWNEPAPKLLADTNVHVSGVISLLFLPKGKSLVVGTRDGPVLLWDLGASRVSARFDTDQGIVESLACTPDGAMLVTAGSDCTIKGWRTDEMRETIRFLGHTDIVNCVAISQKTGMLASASTDKTVKLWDMTKRSSGLSLPHEGAVPCVAFSPNGRLLATACGVQTEAVSATSNQAILWDVATGKSVGVLKGHSDAVLAVAFAPDGSTALTGSRDETAILWNVATKKKLAVLRGHSDAIISVAYSPHGDFVATASRDRTARLWKLANGEATLVAPLPGHEGWVRGVAFSPDGKLLASCSSDCTTRLWDVATQQTIAILPGGTSTTVAFSPDGGTLAVGSKDRTVRLWDMAGRHFEHDDATVLEGYRSSILSVAFSPDGKTLAAGGQDSTVMLWSMLSKQEVAVFRPHSGAVLSVAFSPDGNRLATGSTDCTARISQAVSAAEADAPPAAVGVWTSP